MPLSTPLRVPSCFPVWRADQLPSDEWQQASYLSLTVQYPPFNLLLELLGQTICFNRVVCHKKKKVAAWQQGKHSAHRAFLKVFNIL